MSGAAEGEEVRYRKWRAKREKGEEIDIKATGGGGAKYSWYLLLRRQGLEGARERLPVRETPLHYSGRY